MQSKKLSSVQHSISRKNSCLPVLLRLQTLYAGKIAHCILCSVTVQARYQYFFIYFDKKVNNNDSRLCYY